MSKCGYTHYDNRGRKTGNSTPGLFGNINHRDSKGRKTRESTPGLFGTLNYKKK